MLVLKHLVNPVYGFPAYHVTRTRLPETPTRNTKSRRFTHF